MHTLIENVKKGDHSALTELFEIHRERLRQMVQARLDRRIRARVDPADVLQDAFVDLSKQLANYAKNPTLPFEVWLRRLTAQRLAKVHRTHIGQLKRSVLREMPLDTANDARSRLGQNTDPRLDSVVAQGELLSLVQTGIRDLSQVDREILQLRHTRQLSNIQTADELGISVQAASKRYTRAIRQLRSVLRTSFPGLGLAVPDDSPKTPLDSVRSVNPTR